MFDKGQAEIVDSRASWQGEHSLLGKLLLIGLHIGNLEHPELPLFCSFELFLANQDHDIGWAATEDMGNVFQFKGVEFNISGHRGLTLYLNIRFNGSLMYHNQDDVKTQ